MADVDAVIYLRQSQDRTGQEFGIERQRADARKLAELRGWTVVAEYPDNDISAAGKRVRPGFEAIITALRERRATAVIAWDMTRLSRNARDTLRLMEAGQAAGAMLSFVRGSDLNLASADGRTLAGILSSIAQGEIDKKSERQRAAAAQAAQQGRRIGGRRPFGSEPDGMTVREPEAAAVRDGYEAVLAGVPLGRIAADWNGRGLTTPQTKRDGSASLWTAQTVRPVLLNPRYAGLRSHVTQELRESMNPRAARIKAVVGQAAWPAIVSEETWRAVVDVLTDPGRANLPRSARGLLTGLARCGVPECGATVHRGAAPARRGREGHATYRCRAAYGHVGRAAAPVDEYVTEVVIARLERPDASRLIVDDKRPDAAKLRREAQAIRKRLASLARLVADEVLTEADVRRESPRLRAQLAEIEAQQTDAGRADVLGPLVNAPDVRAAVEALDTDRLRVVIDLLMTVTLLPPGRGTRTFRPESVVIDWH
jgi:DNA invertase Pin-like site-specific DNA recombinase